MHDAHQANMMSAVTLVADDAALTAFVDNAVSGTRDRGSNAAKGSGDPVGHRKHKYLPFGDRIS
jgi:hypothetical protein